METNVRIRTASGKIITRTADVEKWISNDGEMFSTADVKGYKHLLVVVDRDECGAIFGKDAD